MGVVGGTAGSGTAGSGTTLPEGIHSGLHASWSGSVGGASSHVTETVNLTSVAASSEPKLTFWAWYQLEEGYDWAYALVSTDGGASWTSLAATAANGSGTTTLDPIGDTGNVLGGGKAYPDGLTGDRRHSRLGSEERPGVLRARPHLTGARNGLFQ